MMKKINSNKYQDMHDRGEVNVWAPIKQTDGSFLPPLAQQWKDDWKRRLKNMNKGKNNG